MSNGHPPTIVRDARGFYWRDYTDDPDHPGYSMVPVTDDNEPVEVEAVYVLQEPSDYFRSTTDRADAALARIAALEKALDRLRLWGEGLPDHGYPPVTGEGWDLLRDIISAARSALEASAVPSEPYMNDYVLDERNRPASAVPSETWGERHHQWHSGGDCGCSWAETLDRRTLPASAVPSEPMPGRRGPDHGPGCDCMAHDLPASAVPETRDLRGKIEAIPHPCHDACIGDRHADCQCAAWMRQEALAALTPTDEEAPR